MFEGNEPATGVGQCLRDLKPTSFYIGENCRGDKPCRPKITEIFLGFVAILRLMKTVLSSHEQAEDRTALKRQCKKPTGQLLAEPYKHQLTREMVGRPIRSPENNDMTSKSAGFHAR